MKRLLALAAALLWLIAPAVPAHAIWNSVENFAFTNLSANSSTFVLRGGNYGVTCHATWGGGNVVLQRLAPDNSTYVSVITAMTADGYATQNLPSGTYKLAVTTATGVYCDIVATVTTQ